MDVTRATLHPSAAIEIRRHAWVSSGSCATCVRCGLWSACVFVGVEVMAVVVVVVVLFVI